MSLCVVTTGWFCGRASRKFLFPECRVILGLKRLMVALTTHGFFNVRLCFPPLHPWCCTSVCVCVRVCLNATDVLLTCSVPGESVWPRPVPLPLLTLLLHVAEGVWAQQTVQQYWHCRVDWRVSGQSKPVIQLQRKYTPTPPLPPHLPFDTSSPNSHL